MVTIEVDLENLMKLMFLSGILFGYIFSYMISQITIKKKKDCTSIFLHDLPNLKKKSKCRGCHKTVEQLRKERFFNRKQE